MRHNAPSPYELYIWNMAERFGWTLEYIASLPLGLFHQWLQVEDGKQRAQIPLRRK